MLNELSVVLLPHGWISIQILFFIWINKVLKFYVMLRGFHHTTAQNTHEKIFTKKIHHNFRTLKSLRQGSYTKQQNEIEKQHLRQCWLSLWVQEFFLRLWKEGKRRGGRETINKIKADIGQYRSYIFFPVWPREIFQQINNVHKFCDSSFVFWNHFIMIILLEKVCFSQWRI